MKHRNRILSVKVERMYDSEPDTSYLEQEGFEDRLEQYRAGQFAFIGIRAVAEVTTGNVVQTITSGGLWGIEDDSDTEYLSSIEQEETEQLRSELESLGFTKRAIAKALAA